MTRAKQTLRDAKQLYRLCLVNGLLDADLVRRVVQEVSRTTNRNRMGVLSQLRRLVRLDCARHTAAVFSGLPLPPALQAGLQEDLSRIYGPGLSTTFAERPELIGGVLVRVSSDVYDGSVLGKLKSLEASF